MAGAYKKTTDALRNTGGSVTALYAYQLKIPTFILMPGYIYEP